jgi:putative SOS response-associated peptidase YedK
MCGRYALSRLPDEIIEEFEITAGLTGAILPADWNIAPTKDIYIIRDRVTSTGVVARELATVSWGLIAPWSKNSEAALKSQSQAINARTETVSEKPTFRSAFKSRRCLIPATGYYEWATELGRYQTKQPFYISSTNPDQPTLAFAGIWDQWVDQNGESHQSAALITRPAVDFLATIHHRMPTFLPKHRWEQWLNPALKEVDQLKLLLEFDNPAIGLRAVPVSTKVNSARNSGPELIAEIELGEPETLF